MNFLIYLVFTVYLTQTYANYSGNDEIPDLLDDCQTDVQCQRICGINSVKSVPKCLKPGFCSCSDEVEHAGNCRQASRPEIIECTHRYQYWNSYIRFRVCHDQQGPKDICVMYVKKEDLEDSKKVQREFPRPYFLPQ